MRFESEPSPGQRRSIRFGGLTANHRIEGSITTASRRLVDFLNRTIAESVSVVEDALVYVGSNSSTTKTSLARIDIGTEVLLLAIPIEDSPPSPPDISIRTSLSIERMLLGIGPFLVMGDACLPKVTRGRGISKATENRFIMLTDAVTRHRHQPDFQERAQVVCVNRRSVEFIGTVMRGG